MRQTSDIDHTISDEMGFDELEGLRVAIDVTQSELCRRMGVSFASYSRWKNWLRGDKRRGQKPQKSSLVSLRNALRGVVGERMAAMEKAMAGAE